MARLVEVRNAYKILAQKLDWEGDLHIGGRIIFFASWRNKM
jgi:hypothetical protein